MCFSMEWLKDILIFCIVIGAVILMLKVIVPYAVSKMGIALGEGWNVILTVFRIFLGALIAIVVVLVCFELISCLLSYANVGALFHTR